MSTKRPLPKLTIAVKSTAKPIDPLPISKASETPVTITPLPPVAFPLDKITKEDKYFLSESGTFKEGEFAINKKGITIGDTPSPQVKKRAESDTSDSDELTLEDLECFETLGRGSGGVVYRARVRNRDFEVALKVMPLEVTEKIRRQLLLELKTLYTSVNPFVVDFFGAFFSEGSIFVALEHMDCGTISDVVRAVGPIPEEILSYFAYSILQALKYLHKERHIIHRDIKPSNILLNTLGAVKVADFGVSGQLASSISSAVSWVGTVTYMSPERIQGQSYSYSSDLWSLGITLLECSLGRFPYGTKMTGNNESGFWGLLDQIVSKPVPAFPPTASPHLTDFVSHMLHKDPSKRVSARRLLSHPFIKLYVSDADTTDTIRKRIAAWLAEKDIVGYIRSRTVAAEPSHEDLTTNTTHSMTAEMANLNITFQS